MTSNVDHAPPPTEALPPRSARSTGSRRFSPDRYGTLGFFLVFFIVIGVTEGPAFLSEDNLRVVIGQNSFLAFIAASVTLTLIAGQFDLSAGALAGLSAILTAQFAIVQQVGTLAAVGLVVLCGAAAGLLNGLLVTKAKVNVFIATLGTSGAFAGTAQWVSDGKTIFGQMPSVLLSAGTGSFLGVPMPGYFAVALLVVMWVLTRQTVLGRQWYASGASPEAARLAGVKVERVTVYAFIGGGILAALSGLLFTATFASASPSTGPDLLLPAFAAAFLGSSILSDGKFTVAGSIIGTFLIVLATNGLDIIGVDSSIKLAFNGAVLIAAVGVTEYLRRRARTRRARP